MSQEDPLLVLVDRGNRLVFENRATFLEAFVLFNQRESRKYSGSVQRSLSSAYGFAVEVNSATNNETFLMKKQYMVGSLDAAKRLFESDQNA